MGVVLMKILWLVFMPFLTAVTIVLVVTYPLIDFFSVAGFRVTLIIFVPIIYVLLALRMRKEIAAHPDRWITRFL